MTKHKKLTESAKSQESQPLKVEFAPGCFDHLDVASQEELNSIMTEIQHMLGNVTSEQLEAMSTLVTDETLAEMDPRERDILMQAFDAHDTNFRKRKLQ